MRVQTNIYLSSRMIFLDNLTIPLSYHAECAVVLLNFTCSPRVHIFGVKEGEEGKKQEKRKE